MSKNKTTKPIITFQTSSENQQCLHNSQSQLPDRQLINSLNKNIIDSNAKIFTDQQTRLGFGLIEEKDNSTYRLRKSSSTKKSFLTEKINNENQKMNKQVLKWQVIYINNQFGLFAKQDYQTFEQIDKKIQEEKIKLLKLNSSSSKKQSKQKYTIQKIKKVEDYKTRLYVYKPKITVDGICPTRNIFDDPLINNPQSFKKKIKNQPSQKLENKINDQLQKMNSRFKEQKIQKKKFTIIKNKEITIKPQSVTAYNNINNKIIFLAANPNKNFEKRIHSQENDKKIQPQNDIQQIQRKNIVSRDTTKSVRVSVAKNENKKIKQVIDDRLKKLSNIYDVNFNSIKQDNLNKFTRTQKMFRKNSLKNQQLIHQITKTQKIKGAEYQPLQNNQLLQKSFSKFTQIDIFDNDKEPTIIPLSNSNISKNLQQIQKFSKKLSSKNLVIEPEEKSSIYQPQNTFRDFEDQNESSQKINRHFEKNIRIKRYQNKQSIGKIEQKSLQESQCVITLLDNNSNHNFKQKMQQLNQQCLNIEEQNFIQQEQYFTQRQNMIKQNRQRLNILNQQFQKLKQEVYQSSQCASKEIFKNNTPSRVIKQNLQQETSKYQSAPMISPMISVREYSQHGFNTNQNYPINNTQSNNQYSIMKSQSYKQLYMSKLKNVCWHSQKFQIKQMQKQIVQQEVRQFQDQQFQQQCKALAERKNHFQSKVDESRKNQYKSLKTSSNQNFFKINNSHSNFKIPSKNLKSKNSNTQSKQNINLYIKDRYQCDFNQKLQLKVFQFPHLPPQPTSYMSSKELLSLGRKAYQLFNIKFSENSQLYFKKFRNCAFYQFQNINIIWHYNGKFYIGGWKKSRTQGYPQGHGIQYVPKKYLYEGEYKDGKFNGYGTLKTTNGELYIGNFQRGLKNGHGKSEQFGIIYQGQWRQGKKEGFGKLQNKQKDRYQGYFIKNLKNGKGEQKFSNGNYYQGNYCNGKFHGYGIFQSVNGQMYEGDFIEGKKNGKGYWRSNPHELYQSYSGDFLNDKRSGYGKYLWVDGSSYKGQYLNDLKHGFGILITSFGQYQGNWEKGNPKFKIQNQQYEKYKEKIQIGISKRRIQNDGIIYIENTQKFNSRRINKSESFFKRNSSLKYYQK